MERIINVSSVTQYPASQLLNYVVSYFLACTFGQTLDATEISGAVSGFGQSPEMRYYCHRC